MNCGMNELWRLLLLTTLVPIFTQARHDEDLRPSLSCLLMGDYGCRCQCAILCKTYGCIDWKPSCDSVYCDCKEQWQPVIIEPDIVQEFEGLVDFDDVLAVKFKRTPVFLDLEDTLYENPDLMDEVIYFLRHTHGHGKPFKDQFRLTFPELDDLLKRLKPRPMKEQSIYGTQTPEVPLEPLGNLEPPKSRWGFLSDWWYKPSPETNSKENKERIINMVNGVEKKEDLLSTMKMLKDSGDTSLYTDITKHFLKNGLIMPDGTRILEPISDAKVLKNSLANDGIITAIENKMKEEEEFKRGKKQKQMQQASQVEKKPKIEPLDSNKQPEESKSSSWGLSNWFSSKPTVSNPPKIENELPQVLPKVNLPIYSNYDKKLPPSSVINNQYSPYNDQAESIYDDGYYSETSSENLWHDEEVQSLPVAQQNENWKQEMPVYSTQSNYIAPEYSNLPGDGHYMHNQLDDYNEPAEFESEYPLDQDIEFIDQTYSQPDSLQNSVNTPAKVTQSGNAPPESDWVNFSWEQDNSHISPVEKEFLENKISQIGNELSTPQLGNNSLLVDMPVTNMKLDQPTIADSSYFFGGLTYPQNMSPQNVLNNDHQEIISLDGFDLGSSTSDESSDGRNINFFLNKQPAKESSKPIDAPFISTPLLNKNVLYSEESDENEANNMLQNFLKQANVPVNNSMQDEDMGTMNIGARNLGSNRGFDELQISSPNTKSIESLKTMSPSLDDNSTFDDDYIINRAHLNRLHGIITDSSESVEYIPVKRIIRKKKEKPIENIPAEEALKEKVADKLPTEPVFSYPQSVTSIQFEGLPGSPILQIDGIPFQQFNSNMISKGSTLPKPFTQPQSQLTIQEPKVESVEEFNSHISEGLKNILPAYVTDDVSEYKAEPKKRVKDDNETEYSELLITPLMNSSKLPNTLSQQVPDEKAISENLFSPNIQGKNSFGPTQTKISDSLGEPEMPNPALQYMSKPVNPSKNRGAIPVVQEDQKEETGSMPSPSLTGIPGKSYINPDKHGNFKQNNLNTQLEKLEPWEESNPHILEGLKNILPAYVTDDISEFIEDEPEPKKQLTDSSKLLKNPLSYQVPGEKATQGNPVSPNIEMKNSLSPTKTKIFDNLNELEMPNSDLQYMSKPVNPPKNRGAIPVVQEDQKEETGHMPSPSLTDIPGKSYINPDKHGNFKQNNLNTQLEKLEPWEESNPHILEGLKNILPAYVTDDISEFIEDEPEPKKQLTDSSKLLKNPLSYQVPGVKATQGNPISPNIEMKNSLGPTKTKIFDNLSELEMPNSASKYTTKPVNPPKNSGKLLAIEEDQIENPESILSPSFTAIPGKLYINPDENATLKQNSPSIEVEKVKPLGESDSYISEGLKNIIPAYVTDDISEFVKDLDETEPKKHAKDDNKTEYSETLNIPLMNSLESLNNPFSQQVPGEKAPLENPFSPSIEAKNHLGPTKTKISDDSGEPEMPNSTSKYFNKPVNPSKNAKNIDKLPAIQEDQTEQTGIISPPSLASPEKSYINPSKNANLQQNMPHSSNYIPTEELANKQSGLNSEISPAHKENLLSNPYEKTVQNNRKPLQSGPLTKGHLNDINKDFFEPPIENNFEKDDSSDRVIDLNSFLGLYDDEPNNKIGSNELLENIFKGFDQTDNPIQHKGDNKAENPDKMHPSNQIIDKTGVNSKIVNPAFTNDDVLFTNDSHLDDFFKFLETPNKNDNHNLESEDLNPSDQKQLEDLNNILFGEKSGVIPLNRLDSFPNSENSPAFSNDNPPDYNNRIMPVAVPSQAPYFSGNGKKPNPSLKSGDKLPVIDEINSSRYNEEPDFNDFFKSPSSPNSVVVKPDENKLDLNMFLGIDGLDEFKDLIDDGFSDEKIKTEVAELDNFSGMDDFSNNAELMPLKRDNHQSVAGQPSTLFDDSSNITLKPNLNKFVTLPSTIPHNKNDENIDLNLFPTEDNVDQVDNLINSLFDNDQQNEENSGNKSQKINDLEDFPGNSGEFDLPNMYKQNARKKAPLLYDLISQNNDRQNKNYDLPYTSDKYLPSKSDEPSFDDFNILLSDNAVENSPLKEGFDQSSFPGVNKEKETSIKNSFPNGFDDFSGLSDFFDDPIPLKNDAFSSEATENVLKTPISFTPISSMTGKPSQGRITDFQPDFIDGSNNSVGLDDYPFPLDNKKRISKNGFLPYNFSSQPGTEASNTLLQGNSPENSTAEKPILQPKIKSGYPVDLQKLPSDFMESFEGGADDTILATKISPSLLSDGIYLPKEDSDLPPTLLSPEGQSNGNEDILGFPMKIPTIDPSSFQDSKNYINSGNNDYNLKDEELPKNNFGELKSPPKNADDLNLAQPLPTPNNTSGFSKPEMILPSIKPTSQKPNKNNSSIKMQGKANPSQKPSKPSSNKPPPIRGNPSTPENDSTFPSVTSNTSRPSRPSKNAEKVLIPTLPASRKLPNSNNLLGYPTISDMTQQLEAYPDGTLSSQSNFYEEPQKYLEFPDITESSLPNQLTEAIPSNLEKSSMKFPNAGTSLQPSSNLQDNSIQMETENIQENDLVVPSKNVAEFPNNVEEIENPFISSNEKFPFLINGQKKQKNSDLFQSLPEISKNTSPLDSKVPIEGDILEFMEQPDIPNNILTSINETPSNPRIVSIKPHLLSTSPEIIDENFFTKEPFDTQPPKDQTAIFANADQDVKHDNEQWNDLVEILPFLNPDNVNSNGIDELVSDYPSDNPVSKLKLGNSFKTGDLAADIEMSKEETTSLPALSDTLLQSGFPIPQTLKAKPSKYPKKSNLLDDLLLPSNFESNQVVEELEMKSEDLLPTEFWKLNSEDQPSKLIEKKNADFPTNENLYPQSSQKPVALLEAENDYSEINLNPDNMISTLLSGPAPSKPTINLDSELNNFLENQNEPPNKNKPKIEKEPKKAFKNVPDTQIPIDSSSILNAQTIEQPLEYNTIDDIKPLTSGHNQYLKNKFSPEGRNQLPTSVTSEVELENDGPLNSITMSPDLKMEEIIDLNQLDQQWPLIEKGQKKFSLKKPDFMNTPITLANISENEVEFDKNLGYDLNNIPNLNEELPLATFESPEKHSNIDQVFSGEYDKELKLNNELEPNNAGSDENIIALKESQYLNNNNNDLENPNLVLIHPGTKNLESLPPQENMTTDNLPVGNLLQPMRGSRLNRPKEQVHDMSRDGTLTESLPELTPQTLPDLNPLEKFIESNFENTYAIEENQESDFFLPSIGKDISDSLDSIKFAQGLDNDTVSLEQLLGDTGPVGKPNKANKAKKVPVFESGDIDSAEEKLLQQVMSNKQKPTKISPIIINDREISDLMENNELLSNNLGDITSQIVPSTLTDSPQSHSSDDINIDGPSINLSKLKAAESDSKISDPLGQILSNVDSDNSQLEFESPTINPLKKSASSTDISLEDPLQTFFKMESNELLPDKTQALGKAPFLYQLDDTNSQLSKPAVDVENNLSLTEEQGVPDKSDLENIFNFDTQNTITFSESNLENSSTPQKEFSSPIPLVTPQSEIPFESDQPLIPQNRRKPAKFQKLMNYINPESINNKPESLQNDTDMPQTFLEALVTENTADSTKIDSLPEIPNDIRFLIDDETGEISSIVVPAQNINVKKPPIFDDQNFLDDNAVGKAPLQQDLTIVEPSNLDKLTGISNNQLEDQLNTPDQKLSVVNDRSEEPPMSLMDILKLSDTNSLPELNLEDSNNPSIDLPPLSKSITPTVNPLSDSEPANKPEALQQFTDQSVLETPVSLMGILKPNPSTIPPKLNSSKNLDDTSTYLPSSKNTPYDDLPASNPINISEKSTQLNDLSPEPPVSIMDILKLNDFDSPSDNWLNKNTADKLSNEPVRSSPIVNLNTPTISQQKPGQTVRPSLPRSRPSNSQPPPSGSSSSSSLKNKNVTNMPVTEPVNTPSANLDTSITKVEPIPQSASTKPPAIEPPKPAPSMKKPITPRPIQIAAQPNKTGSQTSPQNDSNIESTPKKPMPDNVQQKINDLMNSFSDEAGDSLSSDPFKMDDPLLFGLGQPSKPKPTIKATNDNTRPPRNNNGSSMSSQPSRPTQQQAPTSPKPQTLPANVKPPIKPSPSVSNNRPQTATNNPPAKTPDFDINDAFSIFVNKETTPVTNSVSSKPIERAPKLDFDGFGDLDIFAGDDKFTEQELLLAARNPKIRPDILLSTQNTGSTNTDTPKVEKPPRPSFAMRNG